MIYIIISYLFVGAFIVGLTQPTNWHEEITSGWMLFIAALVIILWPLFLVAGIGMKVARTMDNT